MGQTILGAGKRRLQVAASGHSRRLPLLASALVAVMLLSACSVMRSPTQRAPVEDRTARASGTAAQQVLPPGAENAGKPGYYSVRPGDTLIRIGLETGQNWRDIQAWNGIADANQIVAGQVLRVVPPVGTAPAASVASASTGPATSAVSSGSVQERPLSSSTTAAAPASPAAAPAQAAPAAADEVAFIWPANGPVIDSFDEARNKGVGIGGRPGEPVMAAADGRVVYAGAGLRGYGNLVILKHNNTYLTAYAHNQALLVREDQMVRQGQRIAEMGSSDTDRVKLHFEVRRQGKPVDPLRHLPSR